MIKGVRRPEEIAALGLSHRLVVRIGALLKKNLAISISVLESAPPGSPLERLLLAPAILEKSSTLIESIMAKGMGVGETPGCKGVLPTPITNNGLNNTETLRSLTKDAPGIPSLPSLGIVLADDGMAVLVLQEELDAGDGWNDAGLKQQISSAPLSSELELAKNSCDLRPSASTGHVISSENLFSCTEIDRWRMKLMTAAAASERMEALRTLLFAPLASAEKFDVLLQGLSDREPEVRAEAAGLLPSLGADRDISEALVAVNHLESGRRQSAADRLLKLLMIPLENRAPGKMEEVARIGVTTPPTPTFQEGKMRRSVGDLELGSVAVCAITGLKAGLDGALTGRFIELLGICAPALGKNTERLAEIVRIITALIRSSSKQENSSSSVEHISIPSQQLMKVLGASAPNLILPVLYGELERCSDPLSEIFLIQSMLDLPEMGTEDDDKLMKVAVNCLARDTDEGRDSRAVGTRLVRRGEKALLAICEGFQKATPGAQKYSLLLLDEICRITPVSTPGLERAATIILQTIDTGSKAMRMAAMEVRLVGNPALTEPTRVRLADAFLGSIGDFVFHFDIEKVEATLLHLGLSAVEPLLVRIAPGRTDDERVRAVRLLGELALSVKATKGQLARMQEALTDVLRRLQTLSLETDFPNRGELLCALGKLAASPATLKEADSIICRTLLDAANSADPELAPQAAEGLSHLASSRRAAPELIVTTSNLFRRLLDESVEDIKVSSSSLNGETVIEISGGEKYTRVLPIVLKGMARLACSSNCPAPVMRELSQVLMARWKKINNAELIWGPANTLLLIEALKQMGCHKTIPATIRMKILKCFAPRHQQTSVMHALTEILAVDNSAATIGAALSVGQAILGRRSADGQYEAEDRQDILKALARIAGRSLDQKSEHGGAPASRRPLPTPADWTPALHNFRSVFINELFKAMKEHVPGACELLAGLQENKNMPQIFRNQIERRMKEYQTS